MKPDELRAAAEDVISWSRRGVIESAKVVAVAHALLSMLPPADDGETLNKPAPVDTDGWCVE